MPKRNEITGKTKEQLDKLTIIENNLKLEIKKLISSYETKFKFKIIGITKKGGRIKPIDPNLIDFFISMDINDLDKL